MHGAVGFNTRRKSLGGGACSDVSTHAYSSDHHANYEPNNSAAQTPVTVHGAKTNLDDVKPKFFRGRRIAVFALMSALISPGLTWSRVQADGETVSCSISGSFSVSGGVVTGNTTCIGVAAIPNTVTSIGNYAFKDATGVTEVLFEAGSSLQTLGVGAFQNATNLASVEIPASVSSIGESAFQGSSYLSSIVFHGNAPTIAQYAFHVINGDPSFMSPYSATGFEVGPDGLWNGIPMAKFVNCSVSGRAIFSGDGASLTGRSACVGSLTIPSGVTSIGDMAFFGDTAITSVEVPRTVTAIGGQAFQDASNIMSITFRGNAPTLGSNVFSGITNATVFASVGATGFPTNSLGKWNGLPLRQPAWASVKPKITGKPFATVDGRNKLIANKGTWFGGPIPSITYKWYACNSAITAPIKAVPTNCTRINGATSDQLAVKMSQKGKYIAVAVTGRATGSPSTTWVSKTTSRVS